MAKERLGPLEAAVDQAVSGLIGDVPRIWDGDHTVWQDDPTEVADRLGWLRCPDEFRGDLDHLRGFVGGVLEADIDHVVLVGMGGSSLYPEVLASTFAAVEGHPELHVLDSTDPAAVLRIHRELPWDRVLLVTSSKSGTTTETRSHLAYFWDVLVDLFGVEAGRRCVAVTDPGSALADLARARSFRAVFENPPDIGGRFSALSFFGLVPGALLGLDLVAHLDRAAAMAGTARSDHPEVNAPLRLGAVMGVAARAGRDKLTVLLPEALAPFGAWIEQLVAESTGKHGTGILPVVDEPVLPAEAYGDDRLFIAYPGVETDELVAAGHPVVELDPAGPADLPGEVFRWEFATAVTGAVLGLNPFDQPDVQSAKTATKRALDEGFEAADATDPSALLDQVAPRDYIALLAFVDPGGEVAGRLPAVAAALRDRHGVPVTVGIGPRYLHSTGQLHKGGPDEGVFLLCVGDDPEDAGIPGERHSFGTLKHAQAAGDLEALEAAGRRAGRVTVDDLLGLA